MTCVLMREKRTQKPREEGHVKREAEIGAVLGHYPKNTRRHQGLEEARKYCFLQPWEGPRCCPHLDFGLWPPEMWENNFLFFEDTHFLVMCYGIVWNEFIGESVRMGKWDECWRLYEMTLLEKEEVMSNFVSIEITKNSGICHVNSTSYL